MVAGVCYFLFSVIDSFGRGVTINVEQIVGTVVIGMAFIVLVAPNRFMSLNLKKSKKSIDDLLGNTVIPSIDHEIASRIPADIASMKAEEKTATALDGTEDVSTGKIVVNEDEKKEDMFNKT